MHLIGVTLLFVGILLTEVRMDDLINSYGSPNQMRNISQNYRVKSGLSILAKVSRLPLDYMLIILLFYYK